MEATPRDLLSFYFVNEARPGDHKSRKSEVNYLPMNVKIPAETLARSTPRLEQPPSFGDSPNTSIHKHSPRRRQTKSLRTNSTVRRCLQAFYSQPTESRGQAGPNSISLYLCALTGITLIQWYFATSLQVTLLKQYSVNVSQEKIQSIRHTHPVMHCWNIPRTHNKCT